MFIYEMWLFDLFFPQVYKYDILRYEYLEVFQSHMHFVITRVNCIKISSA